MNCSIVYRLTDSAGVSSPFGEGVGDCAGICGTKEVNARANKIRQLIRNSSADYADFGRLKSRPADLIGIRVGVSLDLTSMRASVRDWVLHLCVLGVPVVGGAGWL